MTFPSSPNNNQRVIVNDIIYIYESASNAWKKVKATTANVVVTNSANIVSGTASTSTTTGALRVAGGAGITGNVFAGAVYTNSYFYANGTPYANTGFTGSAGIGFSGSSGTGYTGSAGSAGFTGSVGFTGSAGSAGGVAYSVVNNGASAYTIAGTDDPTLTLIKGFTYYFNVAASGHPFWIKTAAVTGTGSAYSTGVTNNGVDSGTVTFTVPFNAPATLYYICQFHGSMVGTLNIVDSMQGYTGSAGAAGAAGYTGSVGGSAVYSRSSITATAGQTVFAVAYTVGYLEVFFNGALLNSVDYTASNGTTVVLTDPAAAGDIVEFVAYAMMPVANVSTATFNSTNITSNLAITAGYSAVSVGPLTIAANVVISIANGQKWVIL